MIKTALLTIKDLLLFYILIILIYYVVHDTTTYVNNHQESFVHELDRTCMDYMYTAQRHLYILKEFLCDDNENSQKIDTLIEKLSRLEDQYKKNSPGVMLLGPIATVSIVAKEKEVHTKLLLIMNDIAKLFHDIVSPEEPFTESLTLQTATINNKQYIKKLT